MPNIFEVKKKIREFNKKINVKALLNLASILLFLRFKKKKQDKFTNNKVNNDSVIDLEKDPRTKEYKPKD